MKVKKGFGLVLIVLLVGMLALSACQMPNTAAQQPAASSGETVQAQPTATIPDFWSQPERSQKVMQDRKRLEEAITNDRRIGGMTDDRW